MDATDISRWVNDTQRAIASSHRLFINLDLSDLAGQIEEEFDKISPQFSIGLSLRGGHFHNLREHITRSNRLRYTSLQSGKQSRRMTKCATARPKESSTSQKIQKENLSLFKSVETESLSILMKQLETSKES